MPTTVTEQIRVSVEATYLEERSAPEEASFAFAYQVTIANEGHELVISVHYDGPGGYVINDRVIARVHRSVVQALLRDRI